ncbi:hypothetical protein SNE40_007669 [Patella caerulea]|uniref:Large ribosomal subunit protein mL52 n=1 Tax=Patella caerulea TaxID=87958 RepID=A0AAN8JU66_PATCE
MAAHTRLLAKLLTRNGTTFNCVLRSVHTSQCLTAGYKRRLQKGEAANKTRYGPLTDLPDYTYLDGRPTPLTLGQKKRKEDRINVAKRVVELVQEIQFAKENHKNRTLQQEKERQEKLSRKLKPKVGS